MSVKYRVVTTTGKDKGKTSASVFIQLFGEKGETNKVKLEKFSNGDRDTTIEAKDVGIIQRIRIGHDNGGFSPGFFLEKIVVINSKTGAQSDFICHRFLSTKEDDGQITRDIYSTKENAALVGYKIAVYTGNEKGAGTNANVFIQMFGTQSDTGERNLAATGKDCFEKGHTDSIDVGALTKIKLGHDNSGVGAAWHVDKIIISNDKRGQWTFSINKWFDKSHGDGLIIREIPVDSSFGPSATSYSVKVTTGDLRGAGTTSSVSIEMFGDQRNSPKMPLESGRNNFARGNTDSFTLEMLDLGNISKIKIGQDGSGGGWFLEKVVVTNLRTNKEWTFGCGLWLSTEEGDKVLEMELPVTNSAQLEPSVTTYQVTVVTGDIRGAGTDARVFLDIYGTKNKNEKNFLENSANNFERGHSDVFSLSSVNLGDLQKIRIGHNNEGVGAAWFLETVTIEAKHNGQSWTFPCGQWLDKTTHIRELAPSNLPALQGVKYLVKVKTGDVRGAGTDANVFAEIFGKNGSTGERKLESSGDNFERGKIDCFKIEAVDLGDLIKLRLGHDGSGFGSGWFVDNISVTNEKSGTQWLFNCNRWLDKGEDDGLIVRELAPESSLSDTKVIKYKVSVRTGDKRGAGTDANVFIILHGENGDSGKRKLEGSGNNFERARVDEFGIEAIDFGDLTKITIGHDGSGFGSGWFLDNVVVRDQTFRNKEYKFQCGRWLDKGEDDGAIVREIELSESISNLTTVVYEVRVSTGDRRGAGTDATVSIVLYGENNTYSGQPKVLQNASNNFERAQTDVFSVESTDLGNLTKIRIGHNGEGIGSGWFLDKWAFLCGRWLDKNEDDGQIIREIPASNDGIASLPLVKYKLAVKTGNVRGAGTDANVFAQLFGEIGDTGERKLECSGNNFERGQTNEFGLEAVSLGEITKLRIGHDGKGFGSGWFLDYVVASEIESKKTWVFNCNKWLDKGEGDGLIVRDLVAISDGKPSNVDVVTFRVSVHTGDKRGAGTDANVFVILHGDKGDTGKRKLESAGNNFERGKIDQFGIEAFDVGEITKITIGHDGSGFGSGWFLDNVVVRDETLRNREYKFQCGRWLDKGEDDGAIERELPLSEVIENCSTIVYTVKVLTGDRRGAGTDATVSITLFGDNGDSGKAKVLQNASNNFERASTDVFSVECSDLGNVSKIKIGHDGSGFGSGWFLDKVYVINPISKQQWVFLCGRWLDTSEDDGLIARELTASEDGVASSPLVRYKVEVKTGDIRGAGTDANVFFQLFGQHGDTGERKLEGSGNNFERGQTNTFGIEAVDLGEITKARVGHDGSGFGSGWFLDNIFVTDENTNKRWVFNCGRWLDKGEDDGQIIRDLAPESDGTASGIKVAKYKISVRTGDKRGAGTDANVHIVLHGETGSTAKFKLESAGNNFERGRVDQFGIEAFDVGLLTKITIGHDGTGFGSGWFLDNVIVRDQTVHNKEYKFQCGRWLDKGEDDGQIERELPVSETITDCQTIVYEVKVVTGDRRGAGTDANVSIVLFGENGINSGPPKLLQSTFNNFERGKTDVFGVECADLGNLTKIRIGHDDAGIGSGWFLDKVYVTNPINSQQWVFLSGRWLDKHEDDHQIVREIPASQDGVASLPLVTYKVEVKTGSIRGAGTDANVFAQLFGENGDTGERKLEASGNNFERGETNEFGIEAVSIGELSKLRIGHDGSGFGSGWFLDNVVVTNEKEGKRWVFNCGRWLDKGEDDGQIVRDLSPIVDGVAVGADLVRYRCNVRTGDKRGAGTDANVFIILHGEKGDSGKRALESSGNNFERGKVDSFGIELLDIGDLTKVTIGHDGSGFGSGWFLDNVVIRDETLRNKEYKFQCGRWLDKGEDDGAIVRELPLSSVVEDCTTIVYSIKVLTGDRRGAGTDANVSIVLYGDQGDSGKPKLLQSGSNNFERASTDEFGVETADLGNLTKIRIGHDGKGFGSGWFLDKIYITNPISKQEWVFLCGRWLDKHEDDGQIVRELVPSADGVASVPLVKYKIDVKTGDIRGAGTDANVFLQLFGENGDTGERKLEGSGNNFERGQTNTFGIEAVDLGEIKRARVGHDGSGFGSGWFLDNIVISVEGTNNQWVCNCGRWLDKGEDDGQTVRDLAVESNGIASQVKVVKYKISVRTGDKRGAGTDANVHIILHGETGSSGQYKLESGGNNFERGKVDTFGIEIFDIGDLTKITIGHDGAGFGSGWFLDNVTVRDQTLRNKEYKFQCGRWLDKGEDDGLIERELTVTETISDLTTVIYQIKVLTGDRRGAGTDANVSLTLYGDKGNSGQPKLLQTSSNNFERGATDVFGVECPDLGNLTKIRIGHDGSGFGSGWFLDKVYVINPLNEQQWVFLCGRWLDTSEDDKKTVRELVPSADGVASQPSVKYKIQVKTGDVRGAGTDANVFLQLFGVNGDTGECKLESSGNNFERGKTDEFGIEAVDLGELTKARIGHDGSGFGSGWFLDNVVVSTPDGKQWVFNCGRWLDKGEDDGQTIRDLVPVADGKAQGIAVVKYRVTVQTGDKRGAGTDANVYIILHGANGDTGKRPLESSGNNFERNRKDIFGIEALDIGELTQVTIGHDGSGFGSGWFLDNVIVRDETLRNKEYKFQCGRWLDKGEDDGAIERALALSETVVDSTTVVYEVKVITGDRRGAGTDATVSVVLYGEGVNSGPPKILQNSANNFERAATDLFSVESADLGNLTKIRIGHDGKGIGSGWFLDKIYVTNPITKQQWVFLCGRWLDKSEDDGQTVRELVPSDDGVASLPLITYKVTIKTGDVRGAGTDANVYVQLFGESTDSGERKMEGSGNCFERAKQDVFGIEAVDLGELVKLRVRHDGSGFGSGWFLDHIVVADEKNNKQWVFNCGRWLDKSEDDGAIVREIVPTSGVAANTQIVKYKISVLTGDKRGAGTDANVYIILHGEKGDTGKRPLEGAGNNFERGRVDTFGIEAFDFGELTKITIGHDGSGFGSGWFLDNVIVRDETVRNKEYKFQCGRWLDKAEDDGLIERELPVSSTVVDSKTVVYEVKVVTGDRRGAGTDANVWVVLFGENGSSGRPKVLQSSGASFERASEDTFSVESEDLGSLTKIRIGHDGVGFGSGWFLDKVYVTHPISKQVWAFLCGRWLDKSEDDGQIERELVPSEDGIASQPSVKYRISVKTGDVRGAGTDANVFVQLTGENGTTEEKKLEGSGNNFERGQTDQFTIEILELGELSNLRVGHDGSGLGSGWFLDNVVVTNLKSGKEWVFNCGKWLDKGEDDGQIVRLLSPANAPPTATKVVHYNVHVTTGNVRGAGTDANVFITIYGSSGDTGVRKLDDSKNNFERNQTDVFKLESFDIGEVQRIRIGHDNAGVGAAWYLKEVKIEDEATQKSWKFICNRWLAKDEGDGAIEADFTQDSTGGLEVVPYRITITTPNIRGSGTSANVYIQIFGKQAKTKIIFLDSEKSNFQRNSSDIFGIEDVDVGEIERITVGHDNKGFGPGWFLGRVFIKNMARDVQWRFVANRWLATDEADKKTHVDLVPSKDDGQDIVTYDIEVTTGSKRGAGTDADVRISLIGNKGQSDDHLLDNDKNNFESGKVDHFLIDNVGDITAVRIGHNDKGIGAGWFLMKVIVKNQATGKVWTFPCNMWLDKTEGDKQIVRTLKPGSVDNLKEK